MKKTITSISLVLITFISTSAFIIKNSSGIANQTGSPGETSCSSCHGGGTAAASGITITAAPSFTNDEYVPGTTYTITVAANATGFTHYGFGCEILDGSNANAGTMQAAGTGVKFLTGGGKKNAVHTAPKTGSIASFVFQWVAPVEGSGDATIYAAANAVNANGSTNGDFPIPPVTMPLTEAAPTVTVDTGIHGNGAILASEVSVYPNPSSGFTNISYLLKQSNIIVVELVDITGKTVKELINEKQDPGYHSQILSLQGVIAGIYFVKTSVNNQQVSQKLITIQ